MTASRKSSRVSCLGTCLIDEPLLAIAVGNSLLGLVSVLFNDTGNLTKNQSSAQEIEFDRVRVFYYGFDVMSGEQSEA